MAFVEFKNQKIEVDDEGYIQDMEIWSRDLAEFFAKKDDLELTETHWELIDWIREYFSENQVCPAIRLVTKKIAAIYGLKNAKEGNKKLYELFPDGPARMLVRYAGLSKPAGCV